MQKELHQDPQWGSGVEGGRGR